MTQSSPGSRPRFTIERLRTLVLIGGGVLIVAIGVFLFAGHWTRRFLKTDLPKKLGIEIESQADGVNYTQSRKGKIIFKLHASRAVQMKEGGKSLLHDVVIDLYGEDGNRSDTISGSEFLYDHDTGVAQAAGAVEILLMRPQEKPAVANLKLAKDKTPKASSKRSPSLPGPKSGLNRAPINAALNPVASQITDNEIHVKTSGLTFNQKTGVATTEQRVDFALSQGNGTSIGATYDSSGGHLILDHAVVLHILRTQAQRAQGTATPGPVTVHATHGDFKRTDHLCELTQALAEYSGGTAQMAEALIHFRDDGSVLRLDGSGGVDLRTLSGAHVTAPQGDLEFDESNHPRQGLLQGGAQLEMNQSNRQVQGTSPTAHLDFDAQGQLRKAHMQQGVEFKSRQQTVNAKGFPAELRRTWKSQTADVAFATAEPTPGKPSRQPAGSGHSSQVEPRTIHGYGGVVVTSETTSGGVTTPSRLAADTALAELAPGSVLSSFAGNGHASFQERTATGVNQSTSSDTLDVRFNVPPQSSSKSPTQSVSKISAGSGASDIASMVQTGHVVMTQDQPPQQPGKSNGGKSNGSLSASQSSAHAGIRATANRADYDGKAQILHLSESPRIEDGALDMTANLIDFNRSTSDAFAHGDVKASWSGLSGQDSRLPGAGLLGSGDLSPDSQRPDSQKGGSQRPGGNDPAHAIAAEAELHQATQEVIFRGAAPGTRYSSSRKGQNGNQARLWQAANSVLAPVIILNRQKQTLDAEATGPANPVVTVLVTNSPANSRTANLKAEGSVAGNSAKSGGTPDKKPDSPSVIRLRSGQLHYSEGERLALFHSGVLGSVTAETTGPDGASTVVSQEAEVKLLPAGTRSPKLAPQNAAASPNTNGPANSSANSSIDRLTARGGVTVDWPDRKGTGDKLVYLSEDGTFTLTGTSSTPPRITDQYRGTVTGAALIFDSRSDSVTVEGDGGKTVTDTQTTKKRAVLN